MFEYIKKKQKSNSGFANPGFENLVIIDNTLQHIEIYGEVHNEIMIKNHIYKKIVKQILLSKKKPLILVEHSNHPRLCSLPEEDIHKFEEQIKYSGSEFVFFNLINEPSLKDYVKCIDNRITLGLLPSFIEKKNINMFNNLLSLSRDKLEYLLDEIYPILEETILEYTKNLKIIKSLEDKFLENNLFKIFEKYLKILSKQIIISSRILLSQNLLGNSIFKNVFDSSEKEIINFHVLLNVLINIHFNLKNISSLVVDINIKTIISKSKNENILVFCGSNHSVRLSKLFFSDKINKIYNKKGKIVEDFSERDLQMANLEPINPKIDNNILKYLESQ